MNALPSTSLMQPTTQIDATSAVDSDKQNAPISINKAKINGAKINEAKIAEANKVGFKPVMVDHDLSGGKDSEIRSIAGFNVSPYCSYYNILRTSQYLFQAFTPLGAWAIASGFLDKVGCFEELSKNKESLGLFYKVEAALITGVAMMRTNVECGHMLDDFRLSLAAEFGKDKEEIDLVDAFQSKNPIIEIETKRMMWKFGSRFLSGAGFAVNLTTGLVLSAIDIGAERTLFFANSPYDMLSKSVNDVQYNHLQGDVIKEILIKDMQKSLQAMYGDRGRNVLAQVDMEDLRPTLSKVADDIINKRIGIESIFGIMGGGIIVVGNAKQSEINYDFVSKNMMESVVEIAKERKSRGEDMCFENNIVQFQKRDGSATSLPHDIATTARPEFVQAEKEKLAVKDFSNLGMATR